MRPRVCWQIVSHKTHHSKETKRNKRRWAGLWHNTTVRRSSEETGLISGAWICWSPLRLTWSCVFCLPHSPQGESTCSKSPMLILMPHMVSSNKSKLYLHRGFNGWTQASVCGTAIVSSENSPKRGGGRKGVRGLLLDMEVQTDEEKLRAKPIHAAEQKESCVVQRGTAFTCFPSPRLAAWAEKQKERSLENQRKHKWGISNKRRHFHQRIYHCTRRETQDPLLNPHTPLTAAAADWCCPEGSKSADCGGSQPCLQVWEPRPLAGSQRCPDGRAGGILFYFFPNHWHRLAHPSCCRRASGNKPPKNGYGGKFPPWWGEGL